jgi:DNA-directed RNA polymerase subunit RPC12/RpoP
MFQIGTGDGFVICTGLMLLLCAGLAAYDFWRDRVHGIELSEESLGHCPACRLRFLVARHERVVRCPRCNELCSRGNR